MGGLDQLVLVTHAGTGAHTPVATVPTGRRWVLQRIHGIVLGPAAPTFAVSVVSAGGAQGFVEYVAAQAIATFQDLLRKDVALAGDDIAVFLPVGNTWYGIISGLDLAA